MDIATLDAKHPTYKAKVWRRYDALYRGGETFEQMARQFLVKNPQELDGIYEARLKESFYVSYVGPIADFFAAKLFGATLSIEARKTSKDGVGGEPLQDLDPFYAAFKEDVDLAGTDLVNHGRERFLHALVKGRSWSLVVMPDDGGASPANRAEYEHRELGRARVVALDNEQVYDWELDDRGELLYVIVHALEQRRDNWMSARGKIRETWKVYDRTNVTTFAIEYIASQRSKILVATKESESAHGFSRVPIVHWGFVGMTGGLSLIINGEDVKIPSKIIEGFWLLNRLAAAQIEHFRQISALSWNLKRTCYSMPVLNIESGERPPVMGAGYFLQLGPNDKANWLGPPTGHLSIMLQVVASVKDEIYRIANQMAQGVDNNAAAIGRSGESKSVDDAAAEICLKVFGALVKHSIEELYQLLSDGRGDGLAWDIGGLDIFNIADASTIVANTTEAALLNIPSKTFRVELFQKVIDALLPNLSQDKKDAIHQEIADGVESEPALATILAAMSKASAGPSNAGANSGAGARGAQPPGLAGRTPRAPQTPTS